MKRTLFTISLLILIAKLTVRAQDAALEERLGKLNSYVEGLQEENSNLKKQIASLSRDMQSLREQISQPNANYATHDDVKHLAEKIQEVDKKRVEDNKETAKQIDGLAKLLSQRPPPRNRERPSANTDNPPRGTESSGNTPSPNNGYVHTVATGDTPSTIAQAYSKESGLKITVDMIMKANPGLVAEKLKVGQKINIPKPE